MWGPLLISVMAAGAETSPPGSGELNVIIGGVIVAGITGLAGIIVAGLNARGNRTASTPPSPVLGADTTGLHERAAVLERRADDKDEQMEVVDRRLDQIERHLDIDNVRWRHPND